MLVKTDSDDIIWLKFAPGVISDKPLYLCLCYVLPSGTSRQPIVETSVFDRITDDLATFQSYHGSQCSFIVWRHECKSKGVAVHGHGRQLFASTLAR